MNYDAKLVSSILCGKKGISSLYYTIEYRPGTTTNNDDLNKECNIFIQLLAKADAKRDKNSAMQLIESLRKILSLCNDQAELINLNRFLQETVKKGGFAIQFYKMVADDINMESVINAKKYFEEKNEKHEKAVSKKNNKTNVITSKYDSYFYRPSVDGENYKLNECCDTFIRHLVVVDVNRDDKNKKTLLNCFYRAFGKCENTEEIMNFKKFLKELSEIGGYAAIFYKEVEDMLNDKGRDKAIIESIKYEEERKKKIILLTDDGTKVDCPYFYAKFQIDDEYKNIKMKCNRLITTMVIADLRRDKMALRLISEGVNGILKICNTFNELALFDKFVKDLESFGGIAATMYPEIKRLIEEKRVLLSKNEIESLILNDEVDPSVLGVIKGKSTDKYRI